MGEGLGVHLTAGPCQEEHYGSYIVNNQYPMGSEMQTTVCFG